MCALDTADPWRDIECVWDGYSTRQAAELVGLPESTIRGCVRAGFVVPDISRVPMKLSFRDLRILAAVKELVAQGVPIRRVRRQLSALCSRLPGETSLAELTLSAHGGHVVVRERSRTWRADTGQMVFCFDGEGAWGEVHAMPVRREAAGPDPVAGMSADDWFERGVELEEVDTEQAIDAYERSLRLRRDSGETWINLGRVHAESGDTERAAECFAQALGLDPADATAIYNLGVVAQDVGKDDDAITYYQRALQIEPGLAEAHYNLATVFDRNGDPRSAIRHINEYRKLTRERGG
jgi:hypothetical protein